MKENMRVVYEIEIGHEIQSVDDIKEEEFPVLELLKSEGVPYEIDVRQKMNYERFDEWDGRYDNYYVICVAEEYTEKLRKDFPAELFHMTPKFSELSEEEQKRINDVESDLCVEDDFADADFEESIKALEEMVEKNKKANKEFQKIIWILIIGVILAFVLLMLQQITLCLIVIFSMLIPCFRIERLKKVMSNESQEKLLTQIYAALMKPAKYMTATVREDFLQDTPFVEMYPRAEIETYNKLSLNENGHCYVATEVEAWQKDFLEEEPRKVLDGICVKTKVDRYSEERIVVDLTSEYNEQTDEEELKIEVLKNGYLCNDEILNAEFKERAQALNEQLGGMAGIIYYTGNVAYIWIYGCKLTFEKYEVMDVRDPRKYMEESTQLLNDYVDLAKLFK